MASKPSFACKKESWTMLRTCSILDLFRTTRSYRIQTTSSSKIKKKEAEDPRSERKDRDLYKKNTKNRMDVFVRSSLFRTRGPSFRFSFFLSLFVWWVSLVRIYPSYVGDGSFPDWSVFGFQGIPFGSKRGRDPWFLPNESRRTKNQKKRDREDPKRKGERGTILTVPKGGKKGDSFILHRYDIHVLGAKPSCVRSPSVEVGSYVLVPRQPRERKERRRSSEKKGRRVDHLGKGKDPRRKNHPMKMFQRWVDSLHISR